ncbi:MAG: glycoside hydrolase family 2 protein, partial [Candidatus Hodarchaeota archaeon]
MTPNVVPRPEYPRPEARRDAWLCLNGEWGFEFDEKKLGLKEGWWGKPDFSKKITVPFVYQSKLSGIDCQDIIDTVWYSKKFKVPEKYNDKRVLLHFGAVDYECNVFINGGFVGNHKGGLTPFKYDITDYLKDDKEGEQTLVVHVFDPPFDKSIPRGKQNTGLEMSGAMYEKVTGIWQTVWLEFVNDVYLDRSDYYIRADPATGDVALSIQIAGKAGPQHVVDAQAFDGDVPISEINFSWNGGQDFGAFNAYIELKLNVDPTKFETWSPENPKLYTVKFRVIDGDSDDDDAVLDYLDCSFGFRSFETKGRKCYLNGKEFYFKMALYQGYWPTGVWTAPSDEDIKRDIELTKEMGFNSLRLHQRAEDPR